MCILCVVSRWSRRIVTMLPWLVIPFIITWAFSQLLPPGYRLEVTSTRLACLGVLLGSLGWYELLMPWLSSWRARRSAMMRERRLIEAQETAKWRKEATRRCRNCFTPYKIQSPGCGRFMCTVCGHVSKRPVLEVPASLSHVGGQGVQKGSARSGAGTMSFRGSSARHDSGCWSRSSERKSCWFREGSCKGENCKAWQSFIKVLSYVGSLFSFTGYLWRKITGAGKYLGDSSRAFQKLKDDSSSSLETRGEKARKKANERRQARLEKEFLEAEEKKQREDVARMVEERRRQREEKLQMEMESEREAAAEREREIRRGRELERRRKDKAKEKDGDQIEARSEYEIHAPDTTIKAMEEPNAYKAAKSLDTSKKAKVIESISRDQAAKVKAAIGTSTKSDLFKYAGNAKRRLVSSFNMNSVLRSNGPFTGKADGFWSGGKILKPEAPMSLSSARLSQKSGGETVSSDFGQKKAPLVNAWAKGSETLKGTSLSDRGHVQNGFFEPVNGKKRKPCVQKLSRGDSYQEDECSDLETKILEFMDTSERPELFPLRSELMKAGRSDLVEAILAKGGWMVAGWDMELSSGLQVERLEDSSMAKATGEVLESLGTQNKQLAFLESSLSYLDVPKSATNFNISKETHGLITASNQVRESALAVSSLERRRGWEKVAGFFGLSSATKPEHGEKPHVLVTQEIAKKRPIVNGTSQLATHAQFAGEFGSYRRDDRNQLLAGGSEYSESPPQAVAENKRQRQKSRRNTRTYPPGNESVSSAKKAMPKRGCSSMRSRGPHRKSNEQQEGQKSTSPLSDRIRGLEAELVSTLDILKSGRQALNDDIAENQRHRRASKELEEVSDALEFCETEIMNKKSELRTVRAQRTALEGKLALDLMEFKKDMEEKDKRLAEGTQVLKMLRTARIVWANPASEVFLAGSFDGWTSWRRMEKSSAGVFVTTLQLYPGQYEIKFIVNGEWRLDPNRPVTWANGFDNNVLTVL